MKATAIKIFLILLSYGSLFSQTDNNLITKLFTKDKLVEMQDKSNIEIWYYFPMKTKIDSGKCVGIDTMLNNYYSRQLRSIDEPVLYIRKLKKQIYRFTWLRNEENSIIISIEKDRDDINLNYKMTDGQAWYKSGELILNKTKRLSIKEWKDFNSLIDKSNFWNTFPCDINNGWTSSSDWILEGSTNEHYHVIDFIGPSKKAFYEIFKFLFELTELSEIPGLELQ